MLSLKDVVEPYEGEAHIQIDVREPEAGQWRSWLSESGALRKLRG